MGARAARAALQDAGLEYRLVQQAYAGYVYGDSTAGQAAIYGVGLTGIPVFNVNNNCATGSSALFLARQAVESGAVECALALGFEQMQPGALKAAYDDRPAPVARMADTMVALQGWDDTAPRAAQFFGGAGRHYMAQHGIRRDTFARISVKARQHAARNPFAVFRNTVTLDEVLAAPLVFDPLVSRWDTLVGGLISADESIAETLERETWEEAGLRIAELDGVAPIGRITVRRPVHEGYMVEHIHMFEATVPDGRMPANQDGEVQGFACLPPAQLLPQLEADAFTLEAALILLHALGRL